jgi:hypothetical protein
MTTTDPFTSALAVSLLCSIGLAVVLWLASLGSSGRWRQGLRMTCGLMVLVSMPLAAMLFDGRNEADAAEYALVLTSLPVKPEGLPAFRSAMRDGRMTKAEYRMIVAKDSVSQYDMRFIARTVADNLDHPKP